MGIDKRTSERMDNLEKTVEKHDEMLRGGIEIEGLISIVKQLVEESKQRKYIQSAILIGTIGLLIERIFRMAGLVIDKIL